MRLAAALIVSFLTLNSYSGFGLSPPPVPEALNFACTYEVSQGSHIYTITPFGLNQDVVSFYDYYGASAHTPFVGEFVSALYLYLHTTSGQLYFVFHFNIDILGSADAITTVGLTGIPAGAVVVVSDDPGPMGRPGEFFLGRYPQGQFQYWYNTDGGVLGPLPMGSEWTMEVDISHSGPEPMQIQHWVDGDTARLPLDLSGLITISSVCNQPPVAMGGGPYVGIEGSPIAFNANGSYDPDGDTLTYMWDFEDDGVVDETTNNFTVSHAYPDDFSGRARLTVSDGKLEDSTTVNVTVNNVSPTISFDGVTSRIEGGSIELHFRVTDPGTDDVDIVVDWGDGLPPEHTATLFNPQDEAVGPSHDYGDDGVFPILVTATDDDGGVGIIGGILGIVFNSPPTLVVLTIPPEVEEGSPVTLIATAQDPGSDDLTFSVDFGNGDVQGSVAYNDGVGPDPDPSPLGIYPFIATRMFTTYYPQDGNFNGILTVTDDDGGILSVPFSILVRNAPPTILPFGPIQANEGSPGSVTATATDPGDDALSFHWEFELGPTHDEDFPAAGSPTIATSVAGFLYGDDGSYVLRLTVTDNAGASTTYETTVEVANLPPEAAVVKVSRPGWFTLRVAGEKWHDVQVMFYINDTVVGDLRVVRTPGSPDDQAMSTGEMELPLLSRFSARVLYTPEDDPVNGQPNGANPVWILIGSLAGEPVKVHHTFNVQHPGTYEWDVDLTPFVARLAVNFEAMASDPGSDDLTFEWDFGDGGGKESHTYFNDGAAPDPPKSPDGTFPFTATDEVWHSFPGAGTYMVTLNIIDDDSGLVTKTVMVDIFS